MSFNRQTNCQECGFPLHIQDITFTCWEENTEILKFICSACECENIVKSNLFRKKHITKRYLAVLKEDRAHLPVEIMNKISYHLDKCQDCREMIDEIQLQEIEDRVRFNDRSHTYFCKNRTIILKELNKSEYDFTNGTKKFQYNGNSYELQDIDEFWKKTDSDHQDIFCYVRDDEIVLGMVCFLIFEDKVVLHSVWFRSKESLKKEQKYFKDLKEGKIKIKLSTVKKIFKTLNSD